MAGSEPDPAAFEKNATEAANILRAIANEPPLMIRCMLLAPGASHVTTRA
jgi:hypothetical protein